jgi:hypothetical protein
MAGFILLNLLDIGGGKRTTVQSFRFAEDNLPACH